MLKQQRTIEKPASYNGVGLHTGKRVTITFRPAPINTGIQFVRLDLPNRPSIQADIDHVTDVSRGTTLGDGQARVCTVEHVLSALAGMQIDNLLVELDSEEAPVGDGSALPFVDALLKAGLQEQDSPKDYLTIEETISYSDKERGVDIVVLPSDEFRITFMIDYKNPALGTQYTSMYSLEEEFVSEYASARTFGFLSEVEALREQGLIRGGSLDNAIVIVDKEVD
ncbi:MAG: UDP-3-O-acyl-N-acetylglucosamine deacetylase, partial [bacterium]